MELTIDQAVQQGVAAHKEGKLKDAERLYRAVLQAEPKHPDANHNLGLLAVSVGKLFQALPLLKLALETNPRIEQFWLSYIDALIRAERFDEAKRVLVEAETSDVVSVMLDALNERLQESVPNRMSKSAKNQALSGKRKKAANKKRSKNKKSQGSAPKAEPSQGQINHLTENYQAGSLAEAEALARSLTKQFPKHAFGWKVLGAILNQTGRLNDSLLPMQKSVELSPHDAEAHSNLGATLKALGRLQDAEACYRQAIALKPDCAEAHNNLGNDLRELGRLDDAEASLRRAIDFRPEYAEAHCNLGHTLRELGRLDEAEVSYGQAIALKPDYAQAHCNLGDTIRDLGRLEEACAAYALAINSKQGSNGAFVNLGFTLQSMRFNRANQNLHPVLSDLLTTGNFVRPKQVAPAIVSLLKHEPVIKDLLARSETTILDFKAVVLAIAALHKIPLLHHLMRVCPIPDLKLEKLFASMRRLLLANLTEIQESTELIHFLSSLSLQCFTNEYVYFETARETELAEALQTRIAECLSQSVQPSLADVLCLACYRPLHYRDWLERLRVTDQLPEIKARLIDEPLAERVLVRKIPVMADVEDEVSRKVRDQYEEHPYPRWTKLGIPVKSKSLAEFCHEAKLELVSEVIKDVSNPLILIAGCGTGQHSIESACRFSNCRVTAVDLSLASLAHAQRKTIEYGITNIEYLCADILQLRQLDQTFDIIESVGVLHHMEDPMAGWRVLTDLLPVGGLMKVGLYSELARQHIVAIRKEIESLGVATSAADMRGFRKTLAESRDENKRLLVTSNDFFSLSMIRDAIFHVQEHSFTLPEINACLHELGLKFCGFESARNNKTSFREFHGEKSNISDLILWHEFEKRYTWTFEGMYQFWCQKL